MLGGHQFEFSRDLSHGHGSHTFTAHCDHHAELLAENKVHARCSKSRGEQAIRR
jgi:hypothetical protein